jgi:tetratricopeptide (TPR) repeat protein
MTAATEASMLARVSEQVLSNLQHPGRVVLVQCASAAPLSALVEVIRTELKNSVFVEPPPADEPDAALHALLQLAAPLGPEAVSRALGGASLIEAAKDLGSQLAERVVLLRLPPSWEVMAALDSPEHELFHERAQHVLQGLRNASVLRIVLFTSTRLILHRLGLGNPSLRIPLKPEALGKDTLDALEPWGAYGPALRKVRDALAKQPVGLNRAQLGLIVGLVALGEDACDTIAELAASGMSSGLAAPLSRRLGNLLARPDVAHVRDGLVRYMRSRFPLPVKDAVDVAAIPGDDSVFLTQCAGSIENGRIRLDDCLRPALSAWNHIGDAVTHERLATRYEALDGETHPEGTNAGTMLPWLEKVYHLAHSENLGSDRWSRQKLPSREFYWDRARSLSIEYKDYVGAADVYRACTEKFPDDDYAWHYYSWNLDQLGRKSSEVEKGFRRAVSLNESNRWWNSRLVTFLISQARFQEAEKEWRAALDRLDPNRALVHEDEGLAWHVHRWVVEEWLEAGEVGRARQAFDEIPRALIQRLTDLANLEWRLLDAEEAKDLGESVYPVGMPMDQRWTEPPAAVWKRTETGALLEEWYPGRIVEANKTRVAAAFATREPNRSARRVIRTEISAQRWKDVGGWGLPEDAEGFLVLAYYEGGFEHVFQVTAPLPPWERNRPSLDYRLRYLRTWADAENQRGR